VRGSEDDEEGLGGGEEGCGREGLVAGGGVEHVWGWGRMAKKERKKEDKGKEGGERESAGETERSERAEEKDGVGRRGRRRGAVRRKGETNSNLA
jgi:hypothetical protein